MFNEKTNNLIPYKVSSRVDLINENDWLILDWNESTYDLTFQIQQDLIDFINKGKLNFYGDPDCKELIKALSKHLNVPSEYLSIFNGSDSALNICFECVLNEKDKVVIHEPEYSQVNTFIKMKGANIVPIYSKNVFKPDINDLVKNLSGVKVFYFSNPNNPVGFSFSEKEVELLIDNHPNTIFFLDEAYVDFANESLIDLVFRKKNLIIFRTFSKAYGLAGLRLGYIISNPNNILAINKVRNGKEINSIAQIAGISAIENYSYWSSNIELIKEIRQWTIQEISLIDGFESFTSQGNFVIVRHDKCKEVINYLFKNKILVRDRTNMRGLENCMRISIGKKEQMQKVIKCLSSF